MENLYESLYEDIIRDDDTHNFDIEVINKISGQHDLRSLSRYYNIEDYCTISEPMGDNYLNIIHVNIRSLQKTLTCLHHS